jgi:hypothetical protein
MFTLFFIPVVPISQKYLSVCAQCGVQVKWAKEDAMAMVNRGSSPALSAEPMAPPVPTGPAYQDRGATAWGAGTAPAQPSTNSSENSDWSQTDGNAWQQ